MCVFVFGGVLPTCGELAFCLRVRAGHILGQVSEDLKSGLSPVLCMNLCLCVI